MKKILAVFGAVAVAAVIAPMFAAFEAHVVNVTAQIENALQVKQNSIDFGTVFPQEHLDQPLNVALSTSFLGEDRVDDVKYFIRQKPKCALTNEAGTEIIGPTATGHVNLDSQGNVTIDCGPAPVDPTGQLLPGNWGPLPSLCEYISKEGPDENDDTLPSFHKPYTVVQGDNPDTDVVETWYIDWNDTNGKLQKDNPVTPETEQDFDTVDDWNIDLAVPCFGGYCAQDWEDFVKGINPDALPASQWVQDKDNEHKVFGCDLWVEVSGVSEFENGTE